MFNVLQTRDAWYNKQNKSLLKLGDNDKYTVIKIQYTLLCKTQVIIYNYVYQGQ